MMFGMHGTTGVMGGWGILLTVVLAALVIGIVLAVVVWVSRVGGGSGEGSAWSVLQKRYASGEITRMEFEKKKRDLQR